MGSGYKFSDHKLIRAKFWRTMGFLQVFQVSVYKFQGLVPTLSYPSISEWMPPKFPQYLFV